MKDNRPIFLNLLQMKMPLTAVISFMHRVSGVVLFLATPWLLWLLQQSLGSAQGFDRWHEMMQGMVFSVSIWLVLVAFGHHLFAGFRHVVMDFGLAESFKSATMTSSVVLILDVVWMLIMGVWLW